MNENLKDWSKITLYSCPTDSFKRGFSNYMNRTVYEKSEDIDLLAKDIIVEYLRNNEFFKELKGKKTILYIDRYDDLKERNFNWFKFINFPSRFSYKFFLKNNDFLLKRQYNLLHKNDYDYLVWITYDYERFFDSQYKDLRFKVLGYISKEKLTKYMIKSKPEYDKNNLVYWIININYFDKKYFY